MNSLEKTWNALKSMAPTLLSVLLLVSLATNFIPESFYEQAFSGGWTDLAVGAVTGSIAAGNPSTSYVLGGELLSRGVGLAAVTAFLVAWVTVGIVQFPAEAVLLGKKFAVARNAAAFASAIAVALLTAATMQVVA